MANDVFANGREVSCKAGDGKSICAFPDVCFTPPQTPATPPGVPIPYPNTGMDSDTSGGTKNVKISGKEVMLKNKSCFKKSTGDEPGCAPKKGIITSVNRGKVYFTSWSMDVKCEGENLVRHLDLTTHNHASSQGPNTPPWPFMASMAISDPNDPLKLKDPCEKEKKNEKDACQDYKPKGSKDVCAEAGLTGKVIQKNKSAKAIGFSSSKDWAAHASKKAAANQCLRAKRCKLVPYGANKDGVNGCCPSQTADHLIPKASFFVDGFKKGEGKKLDSWPNYNYKKVPCMCAEGGSNTAGTHGLRHAHHKSNGPSKGSMQSFADQAKLAAQGAVVVFKSSGCSQECIEQQLKTGHEGMGSGDVKHSPSGSKMSDEEIKKRASKISPTTVAE